jgi:hypothetical protein
MKLANRRHALRAAVGTCLVIAASGAGAATLDLEIGGEYSDNVARLPENETEESIGFVGLTLGLTADRPRLDADLSTALEYRKYLDDTFDDELVGGLDGTLAYAFVPERFLWIVQDNFGQIANNRAAVESPDNRQNFNYFTTGPDITVPLGSRTEAELSARYSDTYFEDSVEGSETHQASLALTRTLSERTSVGLVGSAAEVKFDESESFEDSEIQEGFVRLTADGVRTDFSGDLGYTETTRGDVASDGIVVRLDLSREITSRSTLSFSAGSQFASAGDAFRLEQDATGVQTGNEDIVAAADVFRNTYAYLTFDTEQARISISATVRGTRERYETQTLLDRDVVGGDLSLGRQLSERLGVGFFASYSEDEFVNAGFSFDEWAVGANLTWQLSQSWSLDVTAEHFSGSGEGIEREYEENRGVITLHYSIGR